MPAGNTSDPLEISFDFERIDIERTSRLIAQTYRGKGIGMRMLEALLAHPVIAAIPSLAMNTADAHGLYEKLGFGRVSDGMNMKRVRPLPATAE